MDNKTYLEKAMITNDGKSLLRLDDAILKAPLKAQMIHASLGLTGEAGEVADLMKKHIFHEKELDMEHLKKELGDVCWYIALMCDAIGTDFEEIMQMNIDKLSKRYTEGFNVYEANHRKEGDI